MFTGLVETNGIITGFDQNETGATLQVDIPFKEQISMGESIAVNGCCLTVSGLTPEGASFNLLKETLNVTALINLKKGKTVNLERASHMITALYPDGKNFIGEAKVLSTPMGEIVKSLMDEGAKLGVSSRGMGSLEQKNGANYVRDDFYLATAANIVSDPSAPSAFVEGIMEGVEWVWNNGIIEAQVIEKMETEIKKAPR